MDPSDTETVEKIKDSFCEHFSSSRVEHMVVITKDGDVFYCTDNNPMSVNCDYLGEQLRGSYNIHTHPPETTQFSFSTDADIPNAFRDGTAVMEAVDYKYRYRFEVPRDITFEEWDAARARTKNSMMISMFTQDLTEENYVEDNVHVLIQETCKSLGISCYKRWGV